MMPSLLLCTMGSITSSTVHTILLLTKLTVVRLGAVNNIHHPFIIDIRTGNGTKESILEFKSNNGQWTQHATWKIEFIYSRLLTSMNKNRECMVDQ